MLRFVKPGGRRLGVGDERFGMVSAGVGEGAGIVGQLRETSTETIVLSGFACVKVSESPSAILVEKTSP